MHFFLKQTISKGKHSVVLSEDIEKAYDRVVSILILNELLKIDGHFPQLHSLACLQEVVLLSSPYFYW